MGSGRGWFASKYGRIRIQVRPRNFVKISPEMPGKRVIHSLIFKKISHERGDPPLVLSPLRGLRPTAPRSFYVVENPEQCTSISINSFLLRTHLLYLGREWEM